MSRFLGAEAALLGFALLACYLTVSLCQRDCTGVDCPQLDNCIQEVLESGGCCSSCLQKGCTCEGYQYYDCVNAGFKNGKVPEGESYFVDYGSTECSCPAGGGRISCHFISCPEIPPNCIEVVEPADGCMQCERVGCVHGGIKYDAGHSFHINPCRVCHCPHEGGKLMCYPVSDCDPKEVHKPMLAAAAEEHAAGTRDSYPYLFDEHRKHISTTYHHVPNGNAPLFKSPPLEKEEQEDYDYGPTDFPEPYPQSLPFPTLPSSSAKVISLFRDKSERVSAFQNFDRGSKLELIERYGVHDHPADKQEVTETPQSTVRPYMQGDTTAAWHHSQGLTSVQSVPFVDQSPLTHLDSPAHEHSLTAVTSPLNQDVGGETHPKYPRVISESEIDPYVTIAHHQTASESVIPRGPNSQSHVSHQVKGEQSEAESNHPEEVQSIVAPESEDDLEADDGKDEDEEKATLQIGKDVAYSIKPAQQESQGSSYEKTTAEPSTDTPWGVEDHTTPIVPAATTQQPVSVELDESGPSSKPEQRLVNIQVNQMKEAEEAEKRKELDEGESN